MSSILCFISDDSRKKQKRRKYNSFSSLNTQQQTSQMNLCNLAFKILLIAVT